MHSPGTDYDYDLMAINILRKLRGQMTQKQLSQILGFQFNQIGKWEAGVTGIRWRDFVKVCQVLKIPLAESFQKMFCQKSITDLNANTIVGLVVRLYGISKIPSHLKNAGFNKNTVDRWNSGETEPKFSDILKMMGYRPEFYFEWISMLMEISKIGYQKSASKRSVFFVRPDYSEKRPRLEKDHFEAQSQFLVSPGVSQKIKDLLYQVHYEIINLVLSDKNSPEKAPIIVKTHIQPLTKLTR